MCQESFALNTYYYVVVPSIPTYECMYAYLCACIGVGIEEYIHAGFGYTHDIIH